MKELNVGIVACASMQGQIEECLGALAGSLRIYPIVPSCTFSVKIDLIRPYLDRSTSENDVTLLVYGICHPQILALLAEYGDRVVKVEGSNCYEMFLGSEKYTEYHRKCYWMLNKPFFTRWKNEILTGFGAGTSNGRMLIGDAYNKLLYLRFENDELSIDVVEDFARAVGLEYEIYSADTANFKRILKEALASAYSTARVKVPKPSVSYPHQSEMQTILESIGEVIYIVDVNTKQFTFVSPQVKTILGYTPLEFLDIMNDYPWAPFYHEDDRQQVVAGRYKFLVRCLSKGMQEPYEAEYRVKHKNGDVLWVKECIYPSYSSDGVIESFVGKIADITEPKRVEQALRQAQSDLESRVEQRTAELAKANEALRIEITERKKMEETLQESEQKYRYLFEQLNDAAFLVDVETVRILDTNKQGEILVGRTREDIIGMHQSEVHPPGKAKEYRQRFAAHIEKGHAADFDGEAIRKDGTIVPVSISTTPITIGGKRLMIGLFRDITERKQMEEELRIAEQNFRNSLDSSPLGIRVITADGELLYANQAILDIYGYSSVEELKAIPAKQRYTPESYAEHQERKEKRKLGKPVPSNYEISIVRKDGEIRRLVVFRKAVMWGGEAQFQALYLDITERKRAEEALRDSEEKLRLMFESVSDGISVTDLDLNFIEVNKTLVRIHGCESKEDLIGRSAFEFIAEKDRATTMDIGKSILEHREIEIVEGTLLRKDGSEFLGELSIALMTDASGNPIGFIGITRDITERKQVESALRQSEKFSSSLFINSPNPILVLDSDASIRHVNPALEKLTGFTSAELVGRFPPFPWWIEGTYKKNHRNMAIAMRRSRGKCEQLFRTKNGQQFWVEVNFKMVEVGGEFKYNLSNWVDLTERKRLRENMEFYISQITRAQEEERKRIAREIHDEWVQSLAVLALRIDAMAEEVEKLPEDIIERIRGLRTETDTILEGLRRFSHELRPGVIDQIGLVPALEILTEELNRDFGVSTRLEVMGPERRLTAEIELVLFRIAQEALRNVRRHSQATAAVIRLKFTQRKVKLAVSDNGRGFELPKMLSDLAAEGKLGLIGMQERARLLDGKLLVKSRVGRGTRIVIEVET